MSFEANASQPLTRPSLILAVQEGHDAEWDRFYRIYRPFIVGQCTANRIFEPQEVQEIVQRVMQRFHKAGHAYRMGKGGGFRGYLGKMTKYVIFEYWRQKKKLSREVPVDDLDAVATCSGTDMQDELEKAFKREVFHAAMSELSRDPSVNPNHLAVLEMVLQGTDVKSISKEMNVTENQVYVFKHRGISLLKAKVRHYTGEND